MDMQTFATLISTIGFPIVACGYMAWSNEKQREQHHDEMDKITGAVNNNTLALQKLCDMIELGGGGRGND